MNEALLQEWLTSTGGIWTTVVLFTVEFVALGIALTKMPSYNPGIYAMDGWGIALIISGVHAIPTYFMIFEHNLPWVAAIGLALGVLTSVILAVVMSARKRRMAHRSSAA